MSSYDLKMLALVFMLIDHIGEFFPDIVPIGFRWRGCKKSCVYGF